MQAVEDITPPADVGPSALIPQSSILPSDKSGLRRMMSLRRAEAAAKNPHASQAVRDNFISQIPLSKASIVSGYIAQDNEMDVMLLMEALSREGHTLALPTVAAGGTPLIFRLYKPGDRLVRGKFEIMEPPPLSPLVSPSVLLVPLLAFDKTRHRLGTGGGYYDLTLAALRQKGHVLAIGTGFTCQEVPAIPAESHDIRLDRIVTETEVF